MLTRIFRQGLGADDILLEPNADVLRFCLREPAMHTNEARRRVPRTPPPRGDGTGATPEMRASDERELYYAPEQATATSFASGAAESVCVRGGRLSRVHRNRRLSAIPLEGERPCTGSWGTGIAERSGRRTRARRRPRVCHRLRKSCARALRDLGAFARALTSAVSGALDEHHRERGRRLVANARPPAATITSDA